ncbi:MAG: hypothetical protein Harvfovirus1_86 [Harvfovirus sp.]|uniref:Uncharacterized protein n=1 Tax=Harvfovirus sp. TaxID=2487768 RepID=A0A3G5A2N8_9VIRU|nr:MAG: hypothetical protein Harvfovirus1_86 [Harvfovirus sp.]
MSCILCCLTCVTCSCDVKICERMAKCISISLVVLFFSLCFGIENLYFNPIFVVIGTWVISLANLLSFPQLMRLYYGKEMTYDDLLSSNNVAKSETLMGKKFLFIQSFTLSFYLACIATYIVLYVSMPSSFQEFLITFASIWTTFGLGFRIIGKPVMWYCRCKYSNAPIDKFEKLNVSVVGIPIDEKNDTIQTGGV